MIFHPIEREPGNPYSVARWQSAGGRWRIHLDGVLFGVRCHLLHDSSSEDGRGGGAWRWYDVIYCCGADKLSQLVTPRLLMQILGPIDEDAPLDQVKKLFPEQRIKPLYNDPECWAALCTAAGIQHIPLPVPQA